MPGRFPTETWSLSLNDAHAYFISTIQLGRGLLANRQFDQEPDGPIELFDFEGCPYCRKVREVLTELDLSYVCRTCGKGSNTRAEIIDSGGMEQFPYLVDNNTDTSMYESEDIIDYLCSEYGNDRGSIGKKISPFNTARAGVASLVRPRGISVRDGCEDREQPDDLLILYNFEASPFCRKVREILCELNLDYEVRNVGKGSPRRAELKKRAGKVQVPYLIDPNHNREMFESDDIIDYLESNYEK